MRYLTLALLAFACAPPPEGSRYTTERYSGAWRSYDVDAVERYIGSRCVERRITLKLQNGLHFGAVQHVRATDRDCDDTVDHLYFRYPDDELRADGYLPDRIVHAFWTIR